jgi:hypothetical protein
LCVVSDFFRKTKLHKKPPERNEFLSWCRSKAKTVIWFDTTDSTGTTSFGVLPYVDLYAKNQLLHDTSLYKQQFYSGIFYADYYHKLKNIEDDGIQGGFQPAKPDELSKITVSWNLGLGDFHTNTVWGRRLRLYWPWVNYILETTNTNVNRRIKVSYRVTSKFSGLRTISFHREEVRRQLLLLAKTYEYHILANNVKIPYKQYKSEMNETAIVPSPFGLGEICYRDFECFLSGATLLKPDMSHLETWPNYYEPNITYVPYKWDFSDFQTTLLDLIESPEKCRRIAQAGQDGYLHSISQSGGKVFAQHFAGLIQKAIKNSRGG